MILKGKTWILEDAGSNDDGGGGVCVSLCVYICICFHGCLRNTENVHCLQLRR